MSLIVNRKCLERFFLACICCCLVSAVAAQQSAEYKTSIQEIGQQIKQISRNLNANRALIKTEQDKLSDDEQEINRISKQLQATKTQITVQKRLLSDLLDTTKQMEQKHSADKRTLSTLVRGRYIQGKPNFLKLVLNQQNPYAIGRLDNYYEYFSKAQQKKLQGIRAKRTAVQRLKTQQRQATLDLEQAFKEQTQRQSTLQKITEKRTKRIAELDKKVVTSDAKLAQLKKDRGRLNALLAKISVQAEKLKKAQQQQALDASSSQATTRKPFKPHKSAVQGGFKKQRGQLGFPTSGVQKYKFGGRLAESGMRSQGLFFSTDGSVPVKSIYRGRVLFADYLKGYGLLVIVDHGDDHISLYGHNELLYKQVGDVVETQEVVAMSGVSGGLKKHGLYFEIRQNATPVDPASWWRQ